ncbi:hypothetical protein R3W88_000261 [Solanum pinnatisectum]|uniref:Uncharacterized protein n=1 Tax=Solanum pinnatisectum TaxID=50273 RepID=A0AAV9MHQ1_9SOLN|nr:hypothetical protein R3W88_000261 [Solanum pinnatisectum]
MGIKNDVSIRKGSPTHYGGPHKKFSLGARAPDPWANRHEKSGNLGDSQKRNINEKMGVKNCVSICEISSTNYGGPHKVF